MTSFTIDTGYLLPRTPIDASDVTVPIYDLIPIYKGIVDGDYDFLKGRLVPTTALTISSDSIVPTQSQHRIIPQSGTVDQLSTVAHTGSGPDVLLLQLNSPGDEITLVHGVGGNLWMSDGRDIYLNDTNRMVELVWNNSEVLWSVRAVNYDSVRLSDSTLTFISGDIVSAMTTRLELVPESGTADNLVTIQNPSNYGVLLLVPSGASDVITVKHNVGNIFISSGSDFVINGNTISLLLFWDDVTGKWTNALFSDASPTIDITSQDGSGPITINNVDSLDMAPWLINPVYQPMSIATDPFVLIPDIGQLRSTPRPARRKFGLDFHNGPLTTDLFSLGMVCTTVAAGGVAVSQATTRRLSMASTAVAGQIVSRRSALAQFYWNSGLAYEAVALPTNPFGINDYVGRHIFGFINGTPGFAAGVSTFAAGIYGVWFDFTTNVVGPDTYISPRIVVMQAGAVLDTITTFAGSPGAMKATGTVTPGIQWNNFEAFRFSFYVKLPNTIYGRFEGLQNGLTGAYWEASKVIAGLNSTWTGLPHLTFAAVCHQQFNLANVFSIQYYSMYAEGF